MAQEGLRQELRIKRDEIDDIITEMTPVLNLIETRRAANMIGS